ncbi:tail completion protein gp17 [Streptomyces nodosus]|uniref:tail completion protein gp17 n=1 Tax=Streptomyces nodosus TaxID=40318 RepID=UPI0037FF0297
MWPDIELAVIKGVRAGLGGPRVTDEVPAKVETLLPVVVVQVAGGADDRITDTVTVDVACFAADRAAMWQLAERARQAVHALAATMAGGVVIDTVDTEQRPVEVPYGNPAVRRAVATYRLTTRGRTGP